MTVCRSASTATRRFQQAFTLLEIMVVLVIIGIMISLATISIGPVLDNKVDEDARRLDALLGMALEEAGIQGRELGLQFYQHGYEFSARVQQTTEDGELIWVWTPLPQDQLFKPRDLGEDVLLTLELAGEETALLYEYDSEEDYEPQIFILSSGDIEPPFILNIRPAFGDDGLTLDVSETGKTAITYAEF